MSDLASTMFPVAAGITYDEIAWLRVNSPAWRLIRAESAPLLLSFLHQVFVQENVRSIAATELASRLEDELYALNERMPKSFPRPAKAYLDDWASPESGWLRKYYPEGTDEPHLDATPAVEKALQWVRALGERDFVGRYGFRRKPGYVRFRVVAGGAGGYTELTVRADELTTPPPGVRRVYVVENEVTFLAFPLAADAMVTFGGGYAVRVLESLGWLAGMDLVYWGDLDTHGFAILNRLRQCFPHARSMLMNRATLLAHRTQWVTEPSPTTTALDLLTPAEQELYRALGTNVFGSAVRLEQERVSFTSLEAALSRAGD